MVAVEVSKLYNKMKSMPEHYEKLFYDLADKHKEELDLDEFEDECRVIIIIDVREANKLDTDAYVVVSGLYNKPEDTYTYEGVFEGVEFFNYVYQGEGTRGDLYQNLVNELVTNTVQDTEHTEPNQKYITEGAIDILSMFHIYNLEQYTYTIGLDMNIGVSEDGSQLTAEEGIKIYHESNLLMIRMTA